MYYKEYRRPRHTRLPMYLCLFLSVALMVLILPSGAFASSPSENAKKEPTLVTTSENGLPAKGLLLRMASDTEATEDGRYPGFLVKMNPCEDKSHNSQPDNYMNSALAACMYIYTYDSGSQKYVKKGSYRGPIESYGDTEDLSHCFYVSLKPGEVAAFVPKHMRESDRVGREPTEADKYCFRYEIALSSEEEWQMKGVTSSAGGSVALSGGIVSGEYVTDRSTGSHAGKPQEDLVLQTALRTDGQGIAWAAGTKTAYDEKELLDGGLRIDIGDVPGSGVRSALKLTLAVPGDRKNGEGGLGFSRSGSYRDASEGAWTYPIRRIGGGVFAVIQYRRDAGGRYVYRTHVLAEADSEKGASVNLTDFHLKKGDVITVVPVAPAYAAPLRQNLSRGTFSTSIKNGEFLSHTVTMRKYHFSYGISMQNTSEVLHLKGMDGTELKEGENSGTSSADVCDDGSRLQRVSLSVESDGRASATGLQKNGLPNYGLLIDKQSDFPAELYIDPELSSDESCAYYAIEDYRKGQDGVYTRDESTVRLACADRMMHTTILAFPAGTVVSVRRVVPDEKKAAFSSAKNLAEKPRQANYELTDDEGGIIYPTEGKDNYILNPYGNYADRDPGALGRTKTGGIPNADYELYRRADPSSWIKGGGEKVPFTALTANTFTTDLGSTESQVAAVRACEDAEDKKDPIPLRKLDLPDTISDGSWPSGALVVVHRSYDSDADKDDKGANFLLNISAPGGEVFHYAGANGFVGSLTQHVMSHLYRKVKSGDGTWVWQKEAAHSEEDWINAGDQKNFSRMDVKSEYFYGIHAHLRPDEAMVVLPSTDTYDLTYWLDMTDGDTYDILPEKCQVPAGAQHTSRTYFEGTHRHDLGTEENEEAASPGADVLVAATAKKNRGTVRDAGLKVISQNVVPLKVSLFDYDFGDRTHFVKGRQTQKFHFSYDPKNERDDDWNMWHTGPVKGIVKDSLDSSGDPVFNCTTPFVTADAGLFDMTSVDRETDGGTKKVYRDVDFDFLYNKDSREYSYTSAVNAACFDESKNHVFQYNRALGIDGWDEKGAGFFPFNHFTDEGVWGTEEKKNAGIYLIDENRINDHFGFSMTQEFTIPKDGKINGKDIVFSFSGDDDAWLFVDGKLVLDMGGIHERVSGQVNFTKGTYRVRNSVSPWIIAASPSQAVRTEEGSAGPFAPGTSHTFSFFYLERGGTLSDLSIDFNLPDVREPSEEVDSTPAADSGTSSDTPSNPPDSTPEETPTPSPHRGEDILRAGGRSAVLAYGAVGMSCLAALVSALLDEHRKHRR